jgi:hypothetical protein
MARIRTIKPEFPQSETMGRLSRDARLLFIQLWTIADDEGRARASSRMLASLLYPYDDDARKLIGGWLDELEREQCIRRYEAEGSTYLEIVNWLKHQKIDHPSKSRLPAFVEFPRVFANVSRDLAPDLGPRTSTLDQEDIRAVAPATRPEIEKDFDEFWKAYPKRDGSNPRNPARKSFLAAVRSGADPQAIIAAAARYAAECRSKQQINTPYVAQAKTWLNQQRWGDYAAPSGAGPPQPPPGAASDAELREKYAKLNGSRDEAGADHAGELRPHGTGVCNESRGGELPDNRSRQPGMRGLGAVFQPSIGRLAVDVHPPEERGDEAHDGSDPVARVV